MNKNPRWLVGAILLVISVCLFIIVFNIQIR
jgi:hypothetical protein